MRKISKIKNLSGLLDLASIPQYRNGGEYSAGNLVRSIKRMTKREEYLGKPTHNYDFTQSEEWANQHGYYPDERGHRDDRVKKESHPTHPSRGKWKNRELFDLTDKGASDVNYILYGLNDGGQDPQATMTYRGGTVLPEFTVTPKGNYIYNSYDNINVIPKYQNGGETVVEKTLPEVEVYGDQLRRDLQRTGLTYNELSNLNYGAQRQSQIQQREEGVKELAYNAPVTGDVLSLYDVGKDVYSGNYGKAAFGAGLFFLPNIIENPLKRILKRNYDKLFPIDYSTLPNDDIKFIQNDAIPRMLSEWDDVVSKRSSEINQKFGETTLNELKNDVITGNFKELTLEQQKLLTTPEWLKYTFQEDFANQLLAKERSRELLNDPRTYDVIYVNDDLFDLLDEDNKNLEGYYLNDEDLVYVRKSAKDLGTPFHEVYHRINRKIPTPLDRYSEFPDTYRIINPKHKGSSRVSEMAVTNAQTRREILKRAKTKTIEELNDVIDKTEDSKILSDLSAVNAYGEDYSNYIESLKKSERSSVVQRIKDSLKKRGMYIPGLYLIGELYDDENLNIEEYAEGGIHIKKKNRGKFTETMKRTGKTAEELKHSKNPLTRKRAVFALNSRKWAKKK